MLSCPPPYLLLFVCVWGDEVGRGSYAKHVWVLVKPKRTSDPLVLQELTDMWRTWVSLNH